MEPNHENQSHEVSRVIPVEHRCYIMPDWKKQLHHFERIGYRADLWKERKPHHFVRLQIACNIFCYDQMTWATIAPQVTVASKKQDIRVDWYVETGDVSLNQKIQRIARVKASLLK